MDLKKQTSRWTGYRKAEWPIENHTLILMYILLFAARFNCQDLSIDEETKNNTVDINKSDCHSTESSNINVLVSDKAPSTLQDFIRSLENVTEKEALLNKTMGYVELLVDNVLNYERIKIIDGVEIKIKNDTKVVDKERKENNDIEEARGLFSKYTYEYRLYQKIKSFIDTHVLSISLPKAAKFMGFRCKYNNMFYCYYLSYKNHKFSFVALILATTSQRRNRLDKVVLRHFRLIVQIVLCLSETD